MFVGGSLPDDDGEAAAKSVDFRDQNDNGISDVGSEAYFHHESWKRTRVGSSHDHNGTGDENDDGSLDRGSKADFHHDRRKRTRAGNSHDHRGLGNESLMVDR